MKHKNHLRIATLLLPALIMGCGSDSDSSDSKVITVMDGYLHNASICIDRNSNSLCEVDETLPEKTNELGQIKIDSADAQYPIMAMAIAGTTYDSDQLTPISQSYTLIAPANSDYVTPFTTLAYLNNSSLQILAEQFAINYGAISSDYVKNTESESQRAHLIARAITPFFDQQLLANDVAELNTNLEQITALAQTELSSGVDLDAINISYNTELEVFYSSPKETSISPYISDRSFVYTRFSTYRAEFYGLEDEVTFNNGVISYFNINDEYTLERNKLLYGDRSFSYLIMNEDYLLSFTEDNDLGMWTDDSIWSNPTVQIENSFVAGQTFYHLRDINGTIGKESATAKLTKLEFDSENSVVVTPEGEDGFTAVWEVKDWVNWKDETYRVIHIEFPEGQQNRPSLRKEDRMVLEMKLVSDKISVVTNHLTLAVVPENLLIKDENLARVIYRTWLN